MDRRVDSFLLRKGLQPGNPFWVRKDIGVEAAVGADDVSGGGCMMA
jgi:hypothetical protein